MIKIEKSVNIGFCPGVESSIKLINDILSSNKYNKIYMLGEIIHNEIVINELKAKGLIIIKNFKRIPVLKENDILIIQSHGVAPDIYKRLNSKNIRYIDSTCPLVKVIHRAIANLEKDGYYPVIIGNPAHTEVIGISGYAEKKPVIIGKVEEVRKELFNNIEKAGIVLQSTFIKERADAIIKKIKSFVNEVKVKDTICAPTKNRQKEVREKSSKFDMVIVIGSKNSSNTTKLYQIASSVNKNTFFIHKPEDILTLKINNFKSCFVTSGASTPDYIIEKCIKILKDKSNEFKKFSLKYIPLIDEKIEDYFLNKEKEVKNSELRKILKEAKNFCLRPGKRIRPLLLLAGYYGYAKKNIKNDIIKISAAIEIMHSFLLIHDDIMDKAEMRRGEKSFHKIMFESYKNETLNNDIGKDIGIVVGDILFTISLEIIADTKFDYKVKNIFLKYFSECYEITGWGQILDSLASQRKNFNLAENLPEEISTYKTAYYTIYYPLLMGYILAGGSSRTVELNKIKDFAVPLGIAFQLRDDILGVFGDDKKIGKSNISDITEGKFTLLISRTLKLLKGKKQTDFKQLFLLKNKKISDIEKIKNIIIESGAYEKSYKRMQYLFRTALKNVELLKIKSEYKNILKDLIYLLNDLNPVK